MTRPSPRPAAPRAVCGSLVLALVFAAACGDRAPGDSDTTSTAGDTSSTALATTIAITTTGSTTLTPTTADATLTGALTTETSVGASGTTDDCSIVCMLDLPKPVACDLWAQDCSEGEKCVPTASTRDGVWDHSICAPVPSDSKPPGAKCVAHGGIFSGLDDCEKGSVCLFTDAIDMEGECVPLCGGSEIVPLCPEDHTCLTLGDVLHACIPPPCDPLVQDCEPGRTCLKPNGSVWPVCMQIAQGDVGPLESCFPAKYDCAPGHICSWKDSISALCPDDYCCTPYCDLDAPNCPDPAQSCIPLFKNPPSGLEHLGLCMLPP